MRKDQNKRQENRLYAKRFYLTYSQVPDGLTPEILLLKLQSKTDFSQYVIGEESHEDGGKHFHVVLLSRKRKDICLKTTFNIEFEGAEYHSNCQRVTNLNLCVKYVCKGKKVTTNIEDLEDGVILSVTNKIVKMSDEAGVSKAMLHYMTRYPDRAFSGRSAITLERSLKRREELKRADLTSTKNALSTPFSLKDFDLPPRLLKWIEKGCQPTLMLVGPAGCGKTQFVKALASEMDWNMLMVSHKEALKLLTDDHTAIFYDDMSFKDIDEYTLLDLLESNDGKHIRILNKIIPKKKGLVQVIAMNRDVSVQLDMYLRRKEYSRRCKIVEVPHDFIRTVNVTNNIQINVHNNIYNNPENIRENENSFISFCKVAFLQSSNYNC